MSNRILIGLILALSAGTAGGESGESGTTSFNSSIRLGDSDWLLFRPQPREAQVHDLDYIMSRLRCDQAGVGLRYSRSEHFRLNLTLSPLTDRDNLVGPVYDMDIGATRLTFSFSF